MTRDRRTRGVRRSLKRLRGYLLPVPGVFVVPEVLPDVPPPDEPVELPLPLMPEEEPEDVPPEAPLEVEPDLLKCASHSWREIWPSLLVSTDEKLGDELLAAPPAGEPDAPDAPDEPDVDGEEADGVDEEGLLDDDEEDCATANVESANRTAAVVTLRALGMEISVVVRETAPSTAQAPCPVRTAPGPRIRGRSPNYFRARPFK